MVFFDIELEVKTAFTWCFERDTSIHGGQKQNFMSKHSVIEN